jgi:hypothetical protein
MAVKVDLAFALLIRRSRFERFVQRTCQMLRHKRIAPCTIIREMIPTPHTSDV